MEWFRFYHDVLNDPKVQQLPAALFKSWVNILCVASSNGDARGTLPPVPAIAFALRIKPGECLKLVNQLGAAGLLETDEDGTILVHGWDKRQRESDDVSARVRRSRVKKTTQLPRDSSATSSQQSQEIDAALDGEEPECNVTGNVTGNGIVTPSDTDTDNTPKPPGVKEQKERGWSPPKNFVGYYMDGFFRKFGTEPFLGEKETGLLRTFAKKCKTAETYAQCIDGFFADDWAATSNYSVVTLVSQQPDRWLKFEQKRPESQSRGAAPVLLTLTDDMIARMRQEGLSQ